MENEKTTTRLKVDISELKKEMQEAKRYAALADSEFKKVSSTCDDWSQSSDAISAKIKSLNGTLDVQKKKLSILEAEYAQVAAEQGESSAAAVKLATQINKQQAAINKTEKDIGNFKNTLGDVSKAEKIAAATGKDVSEVLDDMGDSANDVEGGFTVLKGTLATFAGNAMTAFAGKVKDGIMNLAGLSGETREYRTELAKMGTAATQAGADTDYVKNKWHDMSAVLGDEGAVSEGLNNLMAAGYNTKDELDGITAHLEGAAIKWKDTLKFEGLADGLQETLATGAAVGPFSEMLERSGVNLDKFNDGLAGCKTEAEKQNFVLQQLSKLGLNEVSAAYREQNSVLIEANKANSGYTDTMAQLGAKVEPITTAVKNGFNSLLEKVLELVNGVDMEAFTAEIEEGFAVLKDDVLPAIKEGFQWILDNKDMLIAGLAGIAAGFVAFNVASMIMSVVNAFKAFKAANEGATIAQWLLNAAMNANPIMLIVTLVAAVIAAIVAFIATNDKAHAKLAEVWNAIKEFMGNAIKTIVKFFTETVPQGLKTMVNFFKELPGEIWGFLSDVVSKVASWGGSLAAKGKEAALQLFNSIVNKVTELPGKMLSAGTDLVRGIWNGISKSFEWIKNKIKGWVGNVTDFVKKLFKIASPSKLWRDEIGIWLSRGIAVGIEKGAKWAENALAKLSKNLLASEQYYLDESARIEREKEEAEYQEKLKNAKNAEELEKIKQERINKEAEKAQKTYLENLKTASENERKMLDDFVNNAVEKMSALEDLQKSIADTFIGEGDTTYSAVSVLTGDGTLNYSRLADVGADNLILSKYNNMLDELSTRRGVLPATIAGLLSEMGISEGMAYVDAMLKASDAEFEKYISGLQEKSRLAEEISKKVTATQVIDLKTELLTQAGELPGEFFDIGADSAADFGESFLSGVGNMLIELKSMLSSGLGNILTTNTGSFAKDIVANLKDSISSMRSKISSVNATLGGSNSTGGGVVNNYTQIINSPTAVNRTDLYRNTKNLLGFAGGVG